jgi:hypothetical protein
MTTLLLTGQRDGSYVISQHSSAGERLLARVLTWRLDSALANGACPDSSAPLSLRAHRLISRTTRQGLSREIHRILRDAKRPPPPHDPRVPICGRKIIQAGPALEQLAAQLLYPGPVDARGVAHVKILLRDGSSPIYQRPQADDLQAAVHTAIDALEVRV